MAMNELGKRKSMQSCHQLPYCLASIVWKHSVLGHLASFGNRSPPISAGCRKKHIQAIFHNGLDFLLVIRRSVLTSWNCSHTLFLRIKMVDSGLNLWATVNRTLQSWVDQKGIRSWCGYSSIHVASDSTTTANVRPHRIGRQVYYCAFVHIYKFMYLCTYHSTSNSAHIGDLHKMSHYCNWK